MPGPLAPPREGPSLREWAGRAFLIALSAALGVGLGEGLLSSLDFRYDPVVMTPEARAAAGSSRWVDPTFTRAFDFEERYFEFHPREIWAPRADHAVFNSQGLRGPEVAGIGPDAYRILALGDSNTLGWLGADVHWPGFLHGAAERRGAVVWNGGVHGHTSYQGLERLERYRELDADLVLVSYGANDGHYRLFSDSDYSARLRRLRALSRFRVGQLVLRALDRALPPGESDVRRRRVSPGEYRRHLELFIERGRRSNQTVMLLTRPVLPRSSRDVYWWANFAEAYNQITREVA
ncbi:MAG: GDSL-type esterase/lipase family protein [Acidobacteriota bacterium]